MTEFLLTVLACSFFCLGVWRSANEGMLLHPYYKWVTRTRILFLFDPAKALTPEQEALVYRHKVRLPKNLPHPTNILKPLIPTKWQKPLITCPTCMASTWGSIAYWGLQFGTQASMQDVYLWPIAVVCISFVNDFVNGYWK
jgi:hypothetical protein